MLTKQEIGRQILHILVGLVLMNLFYFNILSPLAMLLGIIIGGLSSILSKRIKLPGLNFFLNNFERPEQRKVFPGRGMIFYFVGVLLVMQLFEKDIALAAMAVLTLGDSLSHLFGASVGKIKNFFNGHSRKLLEGTFAGTVAGALGAALFVPFPEALLGAAAAMIAEVVDIDLNGKHLDDNLIVPLVAGTVMLLVRTYL
ncbi:hypothetical protein HOC13_03705 [Candidatus Woesearchaeota archaeon]|jgi:dolichol kinase|nr:hypothetical protein [Candidatus Woesearchaeota archaeon]